MIPSPKCSKCTILFFLAKSLAKTNITDVHIWTHAHISEKDFHVSKIWDRLQHPRNTECTTSGDRKQMNDFMNQVHKRQQVTTVSNKKGLLIGNSQLRLIFTFFLIVAHNITSVFWFQNAIANASSLAEVERLKGMLQAGQIPGRDLRQGEC